MEKKMKNEMETQGPLKEYRGMFAKKMENEMGKTRKNEMETVV